VKTEIETNTSSRMVIGVDKRTLVGFGADGKIAVRRRIRRLTIRDAFENLPPCSIVAMEACLRARTAGFGAQASFRLASGK
jgi:hypothetical protein